MLMSFRTLSPSETRHFRQWARDNYEAFSEICGVWHPVVQAECVAINTERATFVTEE